MAVTNLQCVGGEDKALLPGARGLRFRSPLSVTSVLETAEEYMAGNGQTVRAWHEVSLSVAALASSYIRASGGALSLGRFDLDDDDGAGLTTLDVLDETGEDFLARFDNSLGRLWLQGNLLVDGIATFNSILFPVGATPSIGQVARATAGDGATFPVTTQAGHTGGGRGAFALTAGDITLTCDAAAGGSTSTIFLGSAAITLQASSVIALSIGAAFPLYADATHVLLEVGNYLDLTITPTTTPSAPASGFRFFIDSGDGNKLKAIGTASTVTTIAVP